MDKPQNIVDVEKNGVVGARRQFLDVAGRIVLTAPPAITLLLASGGSQPAWASGIRGGGGNYGRGGDGNYGRGNRGRRDD